MIGNPAVFIVAALAASIPAGIGLYAWRRRSRPGALTLAVLMLFLSVWGIANALDFLLPASTFLRVLEQAALLSLAPLWLFFTFQHTGRGAWLSWIRLMLIVAVPLVTLVLLIANGGLETGAWFWIDVAYRIALVSVGSAFLIQQLLVGHRPYALQSLCLLGGFLAPWGVSIVQLFGGPSTPVLLSSALFATGFLFILGVFAWRLLDLSPVSPETMIEGMSAGMLVLDLRNRVADLNSSAERILGCDARQTIGEDFRGVISGSGVAPLKGDRGSALLRNYERHGEAREEIVLSGENPRYYDVTLSELKGLRGRIGHLMALHEVTESRLTAEQLSHKASYDSLTGLPNRSLFHERLGQEISRSRRHGKPLSVFFLDLDRFKEVNDTLGHETGDELLKEVARRLQGAVREYDVVARLAGDEFTVILPELDPPEDAIPVAERIVDALSEPMELSGHELRTTTSIGICFYPDDGETPEELVKNADDAMYQAKAGGRNRYELFTEQTPIQSGKDPDLQAELTHALANDELVLYYQPAMRIEDGKVAGFEALLRWEHPQKGLLYPKDFLPAAEQTKVILQIEDWVLREACKQMVYWQSQDPERDSLRMNVNISSRHLEHPNLVGNISRILRETALSPQSLTLDLGESSLTESPSSEDTLQELKNLGVGLAVDNFGAGYSSLTDLRRFPLDTLKIDRSVVSELQGGSEEMRKVLSAVVSLGHALGLTVSATGVETAQQLMYLRKMGCDTAQGHYFTESLSKKTASTFLASANLY